MIKGLVWERAALEGAPACRAIADGEPVRGLMAAAAERDRFLWLDLTDPAPEDLQRIGEEFNLHPLAVEDAAKHSQRPKVDEYDTFYLMVVFAIQPDDRAAGAAGDASEAPRPGALAATRYRIQEVDLFIGERFLITVHDSPLPYIEETIAHLRHGRVPADGIGGLVYALLDGIVDAYFPVLDSIIERVEELEEVLFTGVVHQGRTYDMRALFQIKRDLLQLRRVIAPERDALLVLARQEVRLFDRQVAVYFQDVYDHVVRVTDQIDVYQDLLTNALESYLSLVSNNLNQVMKTLTSLTVILAVPTLVAGIYGMNFEHMPELQWQYGYPLALGFMALAAGLIFLYFRRRGWI